MRRRWWTRGLTSALLCAGLATAAAAAGSAGGAAKRTAHRTAPGAAPEAAPAAAAPEVLPGALVDEHERAMLRKLLGSPHWPFRAFALMRLERYPAPAVEPVVRPLLADDAWQVRCFALRTAARLGLEVAPESLAEEKDGRVLRTALRCGVPLKGERLEQGARTLMRTESIDQLMLGIEIAAATDDERLRQEAARRAGRLLRNFDDALAVRYSARIARIVDLHEPPADARAWRDWLEREGGRVVLPPPPQRPVTRRLDPPIAATLDAEAFSRLMDYLDVLRQRDLEIAIVMDATASMLPMINEARAGVDELVLFMEDIAASLRLAFVAYRDHDNEPICEAHPFTTDVASIREFLFDLRITGGRDLPEAVLEGLTACRQLAWTRGASKQIVLVGDARPHDDDMYRLTSLLESFSAAGIIVHAVHVPMRINGMYERSMAPDALARYRAEIAEHNTLTAEAFAEIARGGGGDELTLTEADKLVPSIMHLTIEETWWGAFDEFYGVYREVCR